MSEQTRGRGEQRQARWRKSSYSSSNSACVEMAPTADGVLVRNSNDPDGGMVRFTRAELLAFLSGAKAGEFDDLAADPG